jgi:hypothetical protein
MKPPPGSGWGPRTWSTPRCSDGPARPRTSERQNPGTLDTAFGTQPCQKVIFDVSCNYLPLRNRGNSDADPAGRRLRRQHGLAAYQGPRHRTLFVNWGWGLAVFAGVLVSYKSGGHLNPAVTLGWPPQGPPSSSPASRSPRPRSRPTSPPSSSGPSSVRPPAGWPTSSSSTGRTRAVKLGVFSTGPEIRNPLLERRHRGHRHLRAGLRRPGGRALGRLGHAHPRRPRLAGRSRRGPPDRRHRRLARRPDRVRHQPRP